MITATFPVNRVEVLVHGPLIKDILHRSKAHGAVEPEATRLPNSELKQRCLFQLDVLLKLLLDLRWNAKSFIPTREDIIVQLCLDMSLPPRIFQGVLHLFRYGATEQFHLDILCSSFQALEKE